jgi:hypothetical protein
MRFTQPDHTFQLPRRSCNSSFLRSNICTDLAHLYVCLNESIRSFFSENRIDLGSSVGNVGRERFDRLDYGLARPLQR